MIKIIPEYKRIFFLLAIITAIFLQSCKTHQPIVREGGFDFKVTEDKSALNSTYVEYFYEGLKAMNISENDELAISKFQQCLKIYPSSASAMYNLAKLYYRNKREDLSIELMEKATKIETGNKWYFNFLGIMYLRQSQFAKSEKTFEKILALNPYDFSTYYDLANVYLIGKQPLKAIKILDKLEQISGVNQDLTEQKKKIWLSINKLDKAIEEVNKLIQTDPKQPDYIKMLIELYIANKQDEKVIPLYEKLIALDPDDAQSQLIMADYYLKTNNRVKGLELTKKAFNNPDFDIEDKITFIYYNFLSIKDSSNVSNLLTLATILVEVHPDNPRAYAFRGDILNELGKRKEALVDYHKALESEKSLVVLWKKVILLEFDNRNYKECIKVAKESIDYFPTDPDLYYYLGVFYNQVKDYDSTISTLEKGLDWVMGNDSLKGQYYSTLAEAYNSLKNYLKSDLYFEKALKFDSFNATALNNYAYYLSLRKAKLDSAAIMSKKSLQFEPENPAFLDTYGWIFFLKGDYENAEKYIKKALNYDPNDADLLEHYGDVLFKSGKTDDALMYWDKARKNGGKSDVLQKKIREKKYYE